MYLTDTSIWIDLFNSKATPLTIQKFNNNELCLTSLVYFEIFQGIKTPKLHKKIQNILLQQTFYYLHDELNSYEQAAEIYRKCRQNGITPRSTIDCLIVQCAIENNLILLHNDRDFSKIAEVYPLLKEQKI
ncbi:PIN domain protein [uncultured Candidatus Thioglobus sp.]|nr:PIN domain protein [uncultured Candidatus Thioglobus sp.]